MPLNDFVGKRHPQNMGAEDFQKRQQMAARMKVETNPSLRGSSQTKDIPTYQAPRPMSETSVFGESTLGDDSDDTTRGLDGAWDYQTRPIYARNRETLGSANPSHDVASHFDDEAMVDYDGGGRASSNGNDMSEMDQIDYEHGSGIYSDDDPKPTREQHQTRKARDAQNAAVKFHQIQLSLVEANVVTSKNQRSGRFSQTQFNPAVAQSGRETTVNGNHEYHNSEVRPDEPNSCHARNPTAENDFEESYQNSPAVIEDGFDDESVDSADEMQEEGDLFDPGSGESGHGQHTPRANGWLQRKSAPKRKFSVAGLDYDKDALSKMNYSDLKDQLFDNDPKAPPSIIPSDLQAAEVLLQDRLRHFAGSQHDEQANFFAQMPMDQWEESGDWFVQQFSELMSKMQEARRAKREVSRTFEAELARREEAVRERSQNIAGVMQQMRVEGQSVLSGKTS